MTKRAVKLDRKKRQIIVTRKLNPPKFHAWMMSKLTKENPDYTIVEKLND